MKTYLEKLVNGSTLTRDDTHQIMLDIVDGKYSDIQIASLLTGIQISGITAEEVLGFRDGLKETGKQVNLQRDDALDIVGTGGDGKNTFNISTCSAFVVAGAGYYIAKHGNGASTSVSGASNVLQGHGVKFSDDESVLRRSLEEAHFCYLHAPLFALGMKSVGPSRKSLGIPTCFNILGPLINPCSPKYSLHGTATQAQMRLYTAIHQQIGDNYGIVTSYDGYDEISLTSGFKFVTNCFEKVYTPKDLGFNYIEQREIYGGSTAAEAMKIFDSVLDGTSTEAQRNVVIANAACAIGVIDRNMSISESIEMAKESIASGKAKLCLKKFVELNS